MKLIDALRSSLRARVTRTDDKKAEAARHRLESAAEVVAIVAERREIPVTQVMPKYMRMVADLKRVVIDLRKDETRLESRASTCAYNNTFTYVNRLTGESFVIVSYCQATPHIQQLAKDIRKLQDAINAFEPHPDYKMMRRSMKAAAKSAA